MMMINRIVSQLVIKRQTAAVAAAAARSGRGIGIPSQLQSRYLHASVLSWKASGNGDGIWKQFEQAQQAVEQLSSAPDNADKLKLYGLYKQATQGDNTAEAPSRMNMVKYAKWNAWNELKSMSKEDAAQKYIETCKELGADVDATGNASAANSAADTQGSEEVSQFESLKVTKEAGVYKICFNRPAKKNAITFEMYKEIQTALNEAANDDSVSVAVLTGEGDFYSSGNDLSNFSNIPEGGIQEMANTAGEVLREFVETFITFPKVLVAAVNGPAVGIPVTTLPLCDVVYASDKATFHTPFSALGQSPEACSSYTFPRMMGRTRANEVLLFGRKLNAHEGAEYGLVSQVFPHDSFASEIDQRAKDAAALPPQALRLSKQLIRNQERDTLLRVNQEEIDLIKTRWTSEECMNAIMKFMSRGK